MRIESVTDMTEILKLVPIEMSMAKKEPELGAMPLRDRLLWIDCMLNKKPLMTLYDFKVLMVYGDDEKVIGFMVLSILKSHIKYFDEIRIYRSWYNHKFPKARDEVWKLVQDLAKEHKINKIKCEVNRGQKAIERKWDFETISVNMERRV